MWYQIIAPHFVAGIATRNDIVVRTPPILRYMAGWPMNKVMDYVAHKEWKIIDVED